MKRRGDRRCSRNPNAALTPRLVREILRMHELGFGYGWLAKWLGISKSCVQKICNGSRWQSLTNVSR